MILENNEEKRNTIWRVILSVSSGIIIIIAAFFLFRIFNGNPLEGSWVNEDTGSVMVIGNDEEMTLTDAENGETVTVPCSVDTRNKIFTVHSDSAYSEGALTGSYDYSVEQNTLTLTEREYGDQMVFIRK